MPAVMFLFLLLSLSLPLLLPLLLKPLERAVTPGAEAEKGTAAV